ncbi:MAG: LytTR family DNA-binding domain-containing protein, partial [Bacteroidota bacterium]
RSGAGRGRNRFVGWFLVTFQPNDTYTWEHPYKYPFLWGYGIVVFVVLLLMRIVVPFVLPNRFKEKNWTVAKQILYLLLSFLLAFVSCYLYYNWFMEFAFNWRHFFNFLLISSTIGVFPLSAYVLLDYIRQLKRYQSGASAANEQLAKNADNSNTEVILTLNDENGKAQLKVYTTQIYFLQSAMNYVEIFYQQDGHIKKELLRNTLKALESQFTQDYFQRTHRSYIVNLKQIDRVSGNAQGYHLHFVDELVEPIPVSRAKSKQVLAFLQQM